MTIRFIFFAARKMDGLRIGVGAYASASEVARDRKGPAEHLHGNVGLADLGARGTQGRPYAARSTLDFAPYVGEELLRPATPMWFRPPENRTLRAITRSARQLRDAISES
jgi:hypothetical protein